MFYSLFVKHYPLIKQ